jgi:hypothetical protein
MPDELTLTVGPRRIQAANAQSGGLFELANFAAVSRQNEARLEVGLRPDTLAQSVLFQGWQANELDWVEPFSRAGFELGVASPAVHQLLDRASQARHAGRWKLLPQPGVHLQLYLPEYDALSARLRRRFELDLACLAEVGRLKINQHDFSALGRQARRARGWLELAHWLVFLVCLALFDLGFRSGAALDLLAEIGEPLKTILAIGVVGAALVGIFVIPTRGAALVWVALARRSLPRDLAARLLRADPNLHASPDWFISKLIQ